MKTITAILFLGFAAFAAEPQTKPAAPTIPDAIQKAILATQFDVQAEEAATRADVEKVMQAHRGKLMRLQMLAEAPMSDGVKACGEKFEPQRSGLGVECLEKKPEPPPVPANTAPAPVPTPKN